MEFNNIRQPTGFPNEINVVIEISCNSGPVKYEIEENILYVDRFLAVSMNYPCNYGFIPNIIGGDGDPLDALVITRFPIVPGAVVKTKLIGMLIMEDEKGQDEKILAVPIESIDPYYNLINNHSDLPEIQLQQIEHFFTKYKDLEKNKFVKILGWANKEEAIKTILSYKPIR